jgi:hypothetical protein
LIGLFIVGCVAYYWIGILGALAVIPLALAYSPVEGSDVMSSELAEGHAQPAASSRDASDGVAIVLADPDDRAALQSSVVALHRIARQFKIPLMVHVVTVDASESTVRDLETALPATAAPPTGERQHVRAAVSHRGVRRGDFVSGHRASSRRSADFRRARAVHVPGGTLVLGTVDYGRWQWPLIERLYGLLKPTGYAQEHITHFTKDSLVRRLGRLGLTVERIRYICGGEIIIRATKPSGRNARAGEDEGDSA